MKSSAVVLSAGAIKSFERCSQRLLAHAAGRRLLSSGPHKYDVAVVGGGPGGYVAAIKAAQLGLNTVCIEKRGTLGGTCLNVGCIPSKALLNISQKYYEASHDFNKMGISFGGVNAKPSIDIAKMLQQKEKAVKGLASGIEGLFKKNKVDYIKGAAKLKGPHDLDVILTDSSKESVKISSKNIILATGSEASLFPGNVIKVNERTVVTSTGALSLKQVPKRLIVVGGGVIGLELGSVWRRLGAKVDVVEYMDSIAPALDAGMRKALQKSLEKQGFKFHLSSKVTSADVRNNEVTLHYENASGKHQADCDVLLLSVGRRPYSHGLGLEELGIKKDQLGRVIVDDNMNVPSMPSVFAIGDLIRGPMLAHKAEDEGYAVAAYLGGERGSTHINYDAIPNVVYTHPELAGVGKTEEELLTSKIPYKTSVFPFMANSRARTNDDAEGFVKLLTNPTDDRLHGAWIFGPSAGELITELAVAIENGFTVRDIAKTSHAHPTLSEAVKEACLISINGKAIHMF